MFAEMLITVLNALLLIAMGLIGLLATATFIQLITTFRARKLHHPHRLDFNVEDA